MTRSPRWPRLVIVTLIAVIGISGFGSLGIWQVNRLHWKLDLIARVDSRIHADPVPAPGPSDWPDLTAENAEYRRVELHGTFLNQDEVQIYTPSDWGPGYWVLTPLQREDGTIVMINRGVVPEAFRDPATRPAPEGEQTVIGLLRISESHGWLFSRQSDPAARTWYRRDIGSITQTLGLADAAPYFVDQELTDPQGWPRGGRTVVSFRNSHLSYALTWFALTALVLGAWILVIRSELRREDRHEEP
ncbi:SURF1 family protein [Sinirhodobacter populi]|uniref:SURF1-like protein n=1 Tax=Paenirhodobacter populi TaxID=2306993 RepID=A0A443KF46_9RHOB|nr:SURF1 family protein [Sinirhodobacter populi]RWR31316.1 SURF1 family protein [Sinirhodobacter populi]